MTLGELVVDLRIARGFDLEVSPIISPVLPNSFYHREPGDPMADPAFTKRVTDRSDAQGFQYEFHCDK